MNYEDAEEAPVSETIFTIERLKVAFAIAIAYFITTTNMFVDLVLSKIPGAMENGKPSDKSLYICAALIVVVYFLADLAVEADLI